MSGTPYAGLTAAGILLVKTTSFISTSSIAGNPNGFVAGQAGGPSLAPDVLWDWANATLWICTVGGNETTTVWTAIGYQGNSSFGQLTATNIQISGPLSVGTNVPNQLALFGGISGQNPHVFAGNGLAPDATVGFDIHTRGSGGNSIVTFKVDSGPEYFAAASLASSTRYPFTIAGTANAPVQLGAVGGNVLLGGASFANTGSLATTATTGYLMIPFCAGAPTGVPEGAAAGIALIFDKTNHKLYAYDGTWKSATFS